MTTRKASIRTTVWLAICLLAASVGGDVLATEATNQPAPGPVDHFNAHRFVRAAAGFESALRRNPKDAEALIYLGRIAFEQNRLDDAVQYFERATVAAPQSSAAYHWLGRANGIKARDLGIPLGVGPARRTRKALEKAVQLDPNNLEARVELATYYRQAPGIVGGSNRAALAEFQEINRRDPYLGALVKGDLAADEKKFDEAEASYKAALQIDARRAEGHFRLGLLYERMARFDQAFAEFEECLRLDPNEKRALFQIGKTADLSGQRLKRGEEALREYLRCDPFFIMPKLSWAHRRLGNIYLKKGQREAARREYQAALQLEPGDKEAAAALKKLEPSESGGGGADRLVTGG